ncbi:hypothetical protein AB0M39_21975 [Streptomyces sp. NPDC051907]|uniref:hypothetical protein n=1 Tax=Streptomyces sp. NPDC051907 TaxID=3155284 RepID=UPI0034433281
MAVGSLNAGKTSRSSDRAPRSRLESQWHQGNEAATEDLRIALRQYRSFFDRLLTT